MLHNRLQQVDGFTFTYDERGRVVKKSCAKTGAAWTYASLGQYLLQYPGLDIPLGVSSLDISDGIANIGWLTMLEDKLIERIGGLLFFGCRGRCARNFAGCRAP